MLFKIRILTVYILVEQDEMRVEHYFRTGGKTGWKFRLLSESVDKFEFDSIGCRLTLGEVYAEVDFASKE